MNSLSSADMLIYVVLSNPLNFVPIAKRELGEAPYHPQRGILRRNAAAAWLFQRYYEHPDPFNTVLFNSEMPQAVAAQLDRIAAAVRTDMGDDFGPDTIKELVRGAFDESAYQDFLELAAAVKNAPPCLDDLLAEVGKWRDKASLKAGGRGRLRFASEIAAAAQSRLDDLAAGKSEQYRIPFLISGDKDNPLDKRLGGLSAGGLTIIMGESGTGKSAFANKIVFENARRLRTEAKRGCIYVASMEMDGEEWFLRYASSKSEVDTHQGYLGKWDSQSEDYHAISGMMDELADLPLAFAEKAGSTTDEIKADLRDSAEIFGGVTLAVIDFGRLGSLNEGERTRAETERVEKLYYAYREIARNFSNPDGTKLAMVVIAEVSREEAEKKGPRLDMNSVKYGGTYAATEILALINVYQHKDHTNMKTVFDVLDYSKDSLEAADLKGHKVRGEMLVSVVKHRHAGNGFISGLYFDKKYTNWRVSHNVWRSVNLNFDEV